MEEQKKQQKRRIPIKVTDEVLKGAYANNMVVTHTKEEFVLDFINIFPPSGIVNARIITSPGHLKRIIRALTENFQKYEEKHGRVLESVEPQEPHEIQ